MRVVEAKLDKIDSMVINSLMKDGRKSFRQISKEIGVSTPTVESHFSKLVKLGVIKGIIPLFDATRVQNQISAFVFLRVSIPSQAFKIANALSSVPEVGSIYFLTGEFNIMIKVVTDHVEGIEELIRNKITSINGVNSVISQIVTRTMKESQNFPITEGALIKMRCDYCNNEILKHSKVLKVGPYERHFCCGSCVTLYKQKYKGRIEALQLKI